MSLRDRRIQYETAGLDRGDLADDPVEQWHRWYDDAVAEELAEPNAMSVATLGTDGIPDSRMVLVRDVSADGLTFFGSYESAKGEQLDATPAAAVVFPWIAMHRQVRVRGTVVRVDAAESDDYFASRPRGSQIGAWASRQSRPSPSREDLERRVEAAESRFAGQVVPRPPSWGGWRIVPVVWEFWQGRPSRLHDRFRYTAVDGGWEITRRDP